jgi:sulfatase maturation enzyme AslB (radical SAM superfamily)
MDNIFYHIENLLGIKNNKLLPPVMVDIDTVNGRCNVDCIWCCQAKSRRTKKRTYMPIKTMKKMGSFSKQWGIKAWRISGDSEPLLNKDVDVLLESGHKNGISMGLITNGILLDKPKNLRYLSYLGISLDAGTAKKWSELKKSPRKNFHKIIKNIKKVRKECPDLDITIKYLGWDSVLNISKYDFLGGKSDFNPEIRNDGRWYVEQAEELARKLKCNFRKKRAYGRHDNEFYRSEKCMATPLGGVFHADHSFSICCDARGRYVLTNNYTRNRWQELPKLWGSQTHLELIDSIEPDTCLGCAKYNINYLFEDVILQKDPKEVDKLNFI